MAYHHARCALVLRAGPLRCSHALPSAKASDVSHRRRQTCALHTWSLRPRTSRSEPISEKCESSVIGEGELVRSEGERPQRRAARGRAGPLSREWACVSRAKPRFASSSASRALCGGGGSVGKLLRRTLHASHRITQTIDGAAARVATRTAGERRRLDSPVP